MKATKYIVLAVLGGAFASCSDFFTPQSPSAMDAEHVYTNIGRTEQAIAAIYDEFGQDGSYRNRLAAGYHGLNTDIERSSKNSGKADYAIYELSTVQGDLSRANGKDVWGSLNTMVERASNVIEGIQQYSDLTQPEFRYFLGEALTLRAFTYMELVKLWGDVPVRFTSLAGDDTGVNAKKDDRNKIFDQLRIDLKRAAELMPWSVEAPGAAKNYTGRPSKAFALGLLARLNLTYAGYALRPDQIVEGGAASWGVQLNTKNQALRVELYQEALEACAAIMNNGSEDAKFKAKFEEVFKDLCADNTTYNTSEFIWEIPFANGTRGQFMNYNTSNLSSVNGALKNNKSGSTNASQMVVPTLLYDYETGDARRDVTILPYRWYNDNASSVTSGTEQREINFPGTPASRNRLYQKNQNIASYYIGKYRVEWMSRERNGSDDGINYPVMRYTDVLLMFAEAAIGGITGDVPANTTGIDPQVHFDRVRARAGVASKPLTMENLMEERKLEFCGEYIRKYDLQRWGKLKEKMVETTNRLAELRTHSGEFKQTGDTIYFKYRQDNSLVYEGSGLNGYVMDSIWGLRKGEVGRPVTYRTANGWIAKDVFNSTSGNHLNSNDYILYANEETLDNRHYFPIFANNIGASNGTLWNDYGYGN